MAADNLDLRRKRKEAGLSLDDVASRLYGPDMADATRPAISRWERGARRDLPHDKTRSDYDRAIRDIIAERRRGSK